MKQVLLWVSFIFFILINAGCEALLTDRIINLTPTPQWVEASSVMGGICFEAALDAAGRVFVLRDTAALTAFYDLADHSELCRRPIIRSAFDFSQGRVLAGLWSEGKGCTARHEVATFERDDDAQTINLRLRFITEGDCPYELVRPFWVSLPQASGFDVSILAE